MLCVVKLIHTKTVQTETKKIQNVQTVVGPMSPIYRGCPAYKDQAFRQHVVQNQISYASIVKQASPPPVNNTFNFTAKQIVSLVTNVVLQMAQPQLCTKNLPEKQVQAKSDLSKQIAETGKKCLGVNIQGKDVFESIISRPAPPPPVPFVFSSTLAEKKKAPLLKASTVLNKVTPQLVTPSTNSTKSTKAPSLGPQCKSSSKLSSLSPVNLDRKHKTMFLLEGLSLPFDSKTTTIVKKFVSTAVGKIYKIRSNKLRDQEAPWLKVK